MKYYCIIFILLIVVYSCREEVLEYSCDPILNEMIANHRMEYAQYTVKELTASDITVQRAIFRSYTPTKKREMWLEKINFLLANESYTPEENMHVVKLRDQLHENYFDQDSIKAEAGIRKQFFSEWISYARKSLGWSDKYIAFVIYRLYTVPGQLDAELSAIKTISRQAVAASEGYTCNCDATYNDYCWGTNCVNSDCQQTSGCGLLWQSPCNGVCK